MEAFNLLNIPRIFNVQQFLVKVSLLTVVSHRDGMKDLILIDFADLLERVTHSRLAFVEYNAGSCG